MRNYTYNINMSTNSAFRNAYIALLTLMVSLGAVVTECQAVDALLFASSATYGSGSGDARADGVAVDAAGNVFVTGSADDNQMITVKYDNYLNVITSVTCKGPSGAHGYAVAVDTSGNVVERSGHAPYGEVMYLVDGSWTDLTESLTDYLFTGQELEDNGVMYYGARYYSPTLGKFLQGDPILDGLNRYAYCWNNPIRYADPTGLSINFGGGYVPQGYTETEKRKVMPNPSKTDEFKDNNILIGGYSVMALYRD